MEKWQKSTLKSLYVTIPLSLFGGIGMTIRWIMGKSVQIIELIIKFIQSTLLYFLILGIPIGLIVALYSYIHYKK
ncbi:hypothetical protein HN415_10020 [Candidatus Woesearchaeota archaeon]|jgi:hypothetical protein|nr:hypothetical protein [Candidatus Woesearchaeota archaeon]